MSVYKLAGVGSGGVENALAQLDIQFDGVITAIHGSIVNNGTSNAAFSNAEVSFLSVNTIDTNDTRGSLFTLGTKVALVTSGMNNNAANSGIGGLAIAVNAGERLWLHMTATASVATNANIYIYVEDGQAVPVASRRR